MELKWKLSDFFFKKAQTKEIESKNGVLKVQGSGDKPGQ